VPLALPSNAIYSNFALIAGVIDTSANFVVVGSLLTSTLGHAFYVVGAYIIFQLLVRSPLVRLGPPTTSISHQLYLIPETRHHNQ